MKVRDGFVTNSSSTVFVIRNKTDKNLTGADFAKEVYSMLEEDFKEEHTLEDAIAIGKNDKLPARKMIVQIIYDEREGVWELVSNTKKDGETESFEWIHESE
jgi:hypothetical protein